MFIALVNGIVRQKAIGPSTCSKTMADTVVEYCRRSLERDVGVVDLGSVKNEELTPLFSFVGMTKLGVFVQALNTLQ